MNICPRIGFAAAIGICLYPFAGVEAASRNSADILQYIPADTPYVFASTEPLPDKVADKLEAASDKMLKSYQSFLRQMMNEELLKKSAKDGNEEEAEQFREFMEEITGLLSIEGARSMGIERDSAFALYGNGLLPVMRLELSDSKLFDAAISRIEGKSDKELDVAEADGNSYKYVEFAGMRVIIATLDSQAVITVVPAKFDESQVALALGIDAPRSNLKKSKALNSINSKYEFSDFLTGYIDNIRIAQIFTGGASGLDKELFDVIDFEAPELSPTCKSEVMGLVGVAPRMVVGYSAITTEHIDSAMIVEMRDDIAAGLATLPAPVPGLGGDPGGFMSFGFSMNPLKAREFYEARLDAMEKDPFECELFASLQDGVAKGREALNQPIPPVVYGFRGFVANILDIQGVDMASGKPPESVDATILFAIENAESLIMMASMFDPQIAALNLVPDGVPVALEMAQIAAIAEQAFVALTDNALSVSLGKGAEANAASILEANAADPAPFVSFSMDAARYYKLIGEAMMQAEKDEEGEDVSLAMRNAMRDLMVSSGGIYDRMSGTLRFTNRGMEIDSRMTLAD